jgi:predicted AlkP superfamily pyrophosphatase or phosphodiesterase
MKSRFLPLGLLLTAVTIGATAACAQDGDSPTLVVMVSVDQFRGDLIDRYKSAFSGGLRRFLDDGYRFTSASHAHAVTHTAAGHATLSTGVFPSRSGIVANSWSHRTGSVWNPMYAVEDLDSPILGFEQVKGLPGRSPKNLMRTGLADWMRAQDSDARTFSVSSKDRSAITLAGQTDSNVFWLVPQLARFVTSTHYANSYPGWLNRFNEEVMPGIVAETVWESLASPELQRLARADAATYEGDTEHTSFPHLSSQEGGADGPQGHNAWALSHSPADDAVIALAKAGLDEFDLGQRGNVDYLAISLSATDYVGHLYGPFSQEQLSNLINVDRLLGDFFDYLDQQVGEGNWVAGISADHGVATSPEAAQAMGNMEAERGVVEKAYTHQDLTRGELVDSFAVMFRNSHYPGRAHRPLSPYGLEYRFGDGDLVSYPTGTTHGTPYWYDRWVPFMLLGAGVARGSSDSATYTVDMAPTLAALAGIRAPDDLDGRAIYPR